MNGTISQITKTIRQLSRRRWVILGVAALVCAIGWPVVYLMPDKYQSMARVFINSETMLTPLLKGIAVESGANERLAATTRRTLLSRPNLEKVIRETDMDLEAQSEADMQQLIASLAERVEVSGRPRDNIYIISFVDRDPVLANKVVETLLSIFVESTLGVARSDTTVTERFLDEQIKEYEARLEAAEDRLKEFKSKNMGLMPSEAGGYFQRLQSESARLEQAKLELNEATKRRDEILRFIEEERHRRQRQAALAGSATGINTYDERIHALEAKLDDLLLQYTDKHPDVVSLKESIKSLQKQKEEQLKKLENSEYVENIDVADSGVSQELQLSLSNVEAEVSALQVRVSEYSRRVAKLKNLVDTIPKVEAEFARLNRDYDINKQNYMELVNRRESAKISRDAGQSVDDIQFKIIDPPVVPTVPIGPNRPLLYTVVLIVGLALGGVIAWYMALSRPAFYEQNELREHVNLPVYGAVSLVISPQMASQRRMKAVAFVFGVLVLLSGYVLLIVVNALRY